MKRSMVMLVLVASAVVAGGLGTLGQAQDATITLSTGNGPERKTVVIGAEQQAKMAEAHAKMAASQAKMAMHQLIVGGDSHGALADIRAAAAKVHDAKDDEAKAEATQALNGLLDKYFEEDLEARNKELAKIETRLQKLKQQLDRRRERKQEIIDLQFKVALNEAEGLGFYSSPAGYDGSLDGGVPDSVGEAFDHLGRYLWSAPVPTVPATEDVPEPAAAPDWTVPQ